MKPKRYRKKPVEIEAMQFVEGDHVDVMEWIIRNGGDAAIAFHTNHVEITTLEGVMTAQPGDYVIRGVQGEFYPCKPDIFEATYDTAVPMVAETSYTSRETRFIEAE
ncbi:hypothetical protein [Leucobacter sp. GX24907]